MADASALYDALHSIAGHADDDMSERDVENLFLEGEVDDAVYELLDLTEDECEVVEDYLGAF